MSQGVSLVRQTRRCTAYEEQSRNMAYTHAHGAEPYHFRPIFVTMVLNSIRCDSADKGNFQGAESEAIINLISIFRPNASRLNVGQ